MLTVSVHLDVDGDTYQEMLDKALGVLANLLDMGLDSVQDSINLEMVISENEPTIDNDSAYKAEVTARMKNARH